VSEHSTEPNNDPDFIPADDPAFVPPPDEPTEDASLPTDRNAPPQPDQELPNDDQG
jgi:hypothetical protein